MVTFKKIYIEVTNHCNLNCSFCHTSNRPKKSMKVGEFADILARITGYTRFIYLHVLGEAMLHPDFDRFLEISHHCGFQVNLSTNGILLPKKTEILFASPTVRQINISLHSCEHLDKPALEKYLGGVVAFSEKAKKRGLWVNLRLWDVQQDEKSSEYRADNEISKYLQAHFSLPEHCVEDLTSGRSLTLASGIFLSRERRFNWPHAAAETGKRGTCRGLRDHIAILVDGTVVPCCLDAEADIALGNIHHQPLAQILDSPRACRMRGGFLNQQLIEPLCRRCDYRLRFVSP